MAVILKIISHLFYKNYEIAALQKEQYTSQLYLYEKGPHKAVLRLSKNQKSHKHGELSEEASCPGVSLIWSRTEQLTAETK